jgi:hypothetical protein
MSAYSTPLLDSFKQGDVERDVRLLAARGAVAPRVHEQLALLMLLINDSDAEVAAAADVTLRALPADVLSIFLSRTDVSNEMRAFFAGRGVQPADMPGDERDDQPLIDKGEVPEEVKDADEKNTLQRIAAMSVAQRVVTAMKGTREERAILIRDPNKLVTGAVLSSPKLTETEVESIAKMTTVSEEALRTIGRTRAWMKNYSVASGLARNPKTPVALSMNLLARLTDKDLRMISTDRNVPDVLRQSAKRKLVADK